MAVAKDAKFEAVEAIYSALKKLDDAEQRSVLASVYTLLGLEGPRQQLTPAVSAPVHPRQAAAVSSRPVSLGELINDKKPGTNAQRIALFAYYREKSEGLSRFSRSDLEPYFAKARLAPAGNFDRDFGEAVKRGWIHEDGADSYLTTRGVEAIESNYEGERKYAGPKASGKRKTKKKKRRRS